ncbi:MAG TPA: TonB-dependent receptor [Longimicrobiales bacterium]|nr:TonB-dependent receptor [Longimicrobiales bacterium]
MKKLLLSLTVLATLAALPGAGLAQEGGTIAGEVVASDSQRPLWGALIEIPSLGRTAITDARGRFLVLSVPYGSHTLHVSVIGYRQTTVEVTVGAATPALNIALDPDPLLLDELVVTGYGTERRANVAGAVSSMRVEAVREIPVTSINQALQGRMAGVQIIQNSGTPGGANTVRVRGSSSISGGNDPLWVIDGVPVNQGDFSRLGGFGGQSIDALGDLDSNEIESIEILKDASAAAIYGSRASNGVVIVTTKRGSIQRPEVTFGAYYGTQNFWRTVDLLNAAQYTEVYNEGLAARYGVGTYDVTDIVDSRPGTDVDWVSQVTDRAPIASMEASIRGGSERMRYYVSGSSLTQDGVVASQGYHRLNGRINLDYDPSAKVTLGTNVALTRSIYDRAPADNNIYSPWANSLAVPPIQPIYNEDGSWFDTWYANPVAMVKEREAQDRGIRILGNAFAAYTLAEGITGRVSFGLDNLTLRGRAYDSPVYGPAAGSGGQADATASFVNKLTYEARVNVDRTLAERHAVSGVIGTSYEDNVEEGFEVQGQQFPTEYFKYITSAASITDGTSSRADWTLLSYFGRLSYTFDDRITTTLNIRRDGSSRFGQDNRYGTFPSGSVLWRVSEESFMDGMPVLSNLALRVSYGLTGNQQNLGNFASRGLFAGGSNYFDEPGIAPTQLANPNLKWEKTSQLNLGADFSVLSNRLAFNVDYYQKKTTDLLVALPVPRTTGYNSIWDNVGSMENKGFEVAGTARIFVPEEQGGLTWTSTLNVSRNRNKVTELYNGQPIGTTNRVEVGKPLRFFYGYVAEGIFQSYEEIAAHATQTVNSNPARATAPGDIKFKDLNNDGVINADDRQMIGSPWPDYEGGWTNNLSYRNVDLTAFVQFSQGNEINNGFRVYADQFGSGGDNHTTRALDRWTPTHTDTSEPRAIWGDPNQNTRTSSRFIEDGSYVRLKNVVLGFTLPSNLSDRMGVRTARVYLQGQNLYTHTNYTGWDPEVNSAGTSQTTFGWDFYALPQLRTLTFGINVGL